MKHLFPENGIFYKANLHAHTNLSDGKLSPYEVKALYKENGYDIVAFTDHEVMVDQSHLCEKDFLALNGYEMSFARAGRSTPTTPTCHLNLIAKSSAVKKQIAVDPSFLDDSQKQMLGDFEPFTRTYDVNTVNEVLSLCSEAGFFPVLNHPFWSLQSLEEIGAFEGLLGVEVYNHLCRKNGSADKSAAAFDALLAKGKFPLPLACDDNHNHLPQGDPFFDSFGGFEMICAPTLSYDAVIEALEAGYAYASTGPLFECLTSEDGYLCFHTSPIKEARLVGDFRADNALLLAQEGESLTYGRLKIPQSCSYVRLEIVDEQGKTAWTRAYLPSEI
ncbi:MAG: hypothetical protein J6V82_00205 [Clostridia bacterium]|nr:hypothetical protein [Clostridia bacterium]